MRALHFSETPYTMADDKKKTEANAPTTSNPQSSPTSSSQSQGKYSIYVFKNILDLIWILPNHHQKPRLRAKLRQKERVASQAITAITTEC